MCWLINVATTYHIGNPNMLSTQQSPSYLMYASHKLTLKHWETHGCIVSTVATDALVLKPQAISIHNADQTFIVLDQLHIKLLHIRWTASENEITFWKKWPSRLRVNTLSQEQNGWHFDKDMANCICAKEKCTFLLRFLFHSGLIDSNVFYHDMQISWPDSGSPPIRLSDS